MTYIVYADVMLLTNSLINLFTLCAASAIQGKGIRFMSACGWSVLTGLVTEISYILTLNRFYPLHLILYVSVYICMTYFYFMEKGRKHFVVNIFAMLIAMVLLNGLLCLSSNNILLELGNVIPEIILWGGLLWFAGSLFRNIHSKRNYLFKTNLSINGRELCLTGYMDSGNMLTDCFNGNPVIILDYSCLKGIFDEETYNCILDYHETGSFNYLKCEKMNTAAFYPIPYRTVDTKCSFMPAFCLSSLTFPDSHEIHHNVTAAISRYRFNDLMAGSYQVLLNSRINIKPDREENSND